MFGNLALCKSAFFTQLHEARAEFGSRCISRASFRHVGIIAHDFEVLEHLACDNVALLLNCGESKIFIPNLTHFSTAMNQPALELIDRARDTAKAAAHACRDETARRHFEYALALIGEAWIAEDGQTARTPELLIFDVRSALDLFEALAPQPATI